MTIILDRRKDKWNEPGPNRERFLARHRSQIKSAIQKQVFGDMDINAENKEYKIKIVLEAGLEIPKLYWINNGPEWIEFNRFDRGDVIYKPKEGRGPGSGEAGASPDAPDDIFEMEVDLSEDEFLSILFDDVELPNFIKEAPDLIETFEVKSKGYVNDGAAVQLELKKTLENSLARKIALEAAYKQQIAETDDEEVIQDLEEKIKTIPYLEDIDVKYHNRVKVPKPNKKAVVFFGLDVSGSMSQEYREIAKRFFLLFNLFLHRKYDRIEVRYITHTVDAKEESKLDFFNCQRTGGTALSSYYDLANDIITADYDETWNIYSLNASDGEIWQLDPAADAVARLAQKCQFIVYLETNCMSSMYYNPDLRFLSMFEELDLPNAEGIALESRHEVVQAFYNIFKRDK